MPDFTQRTELLIGKAAMERLSSVRVILFGVGGVGSWCAEGLIRSGVRHMTVVDCDAVSPSNLNRQLLATTETIGQRKVEAMRNRLLSINPEAEIVAVDKRVSVESMPEFDLDSYDYVIDAIDALKDKAFLIRAACDSRATLFSSMGAGLKMDPSRIRTGEFWAIHFDPIARMLRKRFRKEKYLPSKPFLCVYSEEIMENAEPQPPDEDDSPVRKAWVNGTLPHITAIFGFTLAGLLIQNVIIDK